MIRNIELKARWTDLGAAERIAAALGARRDGRLWQRDTYFVCRQGRLKLRQWRRIENDMEAVAGSELIGYHRPDRAAARGSDYTRVTIQDGDSLRTLLADTLGVAAEVTKQRTVYLWEGVRIHLDEVERLGTFIEFEAVIGANCNDASGAAKVSQLAKAFGLTDGQIVAGSYCDLLAEER